MLNAYPWVTASSQPVNTETFAFHRLQFQHFPHVIWSDFLSSSFLFPKKAGFLLVYYFRAFFSSVFCVGSVRGRRHNDDIRHFVTLSIGWFKFEICIFQFIYRTTFSRPFLLAISSAAASSNLSILFESGVYQWIARLFVLSCACMQIHLNQYRLRWTITIQCIFQLIVFHFRWGFTM